MSARLIRLGQAPRCQAACGTGTNMTLRAMGSLDQHQADRRQRSPAFPSSSATPCWQTARFNPKVTVEARRYRLRILNACNARFLNLQLFVDDGTPNGITLNNAGAPINAPA